MPTASRKTTTKDSVGPEQDPPVEKSEPVPPESDEATPPDGGEPGEGKIKILNPGTTAVTYSADARQIAAGERLEVEELDEVGEAALDRGYIVKID